jgi:ATP-dependent protease ClpP protease subunit
MANFTIDHDLSPHITTSAGSLERLALPGVPKVPASLSESGAMAWVDIFHRMVDASFHLVTGEIYPARANSLLAGILHYHANRINLLVDTPGGDLYSGVALMDGMALCKCVVLVMGVAAAIAYHLVLSVAWRYGLTHCRLINHLVEGMSSGRTEVLQRTASHQSSLGLKISYAVLEQLASSKADDA